MSLRLTPLRAAAALLLIVYWAALFVGTHVPAPVQVVRTNDKLMHLAAYAGLAFLMVSAIGGYRPRFRAVLGCLFVVIAYGAVDELSQLHVPGRHGDLWDWLADLCGATMGVIAYFIVRGVLLQFSSPVRIST